MQIYYSKIYLLYLLMVYALCVYLHFSVYSNNVSIPLILSFPHTLAERMRITSSVTCTQRLYCDG